MRPCPCIVVGLTAALVRVSDVRLGYSNALVHGIDEGRDTRGGKHWEVMCLLSSAFVFCVRVRQRYRAVQCLAQGLFYSAGSLHEHIRSLL